MDLGVSGLASGFDWRSLIDQLTDVERLPQKRLRIEQQQLRDRNTAYGSLVTELNTLQSKVAELRSTTLFQSRIATVDESGTAKASAEPGALQGAYSFQFLQLATVAKQVGQGNAGQPLSFTSDVSSLQLSEAGFATAVTAGTFTVNGRQVTVATTDSLQDVFDRISTATGGNVAASYDAASDRITLAGTGEVILGSATDTSNFLQVARLNNNGSASISSAGQLGGVRLTAALSDANLNTAITDGGSGQGQFRINGVEITFASTDSMAEVVRRINESGAGVQASYDALNDRFLLANRTTGDVGMALEDVTGNFLAATGLAAGSLQRGKDLEYSINGGDPLTSHSNTITEASSGIAGLSVTALQEGATATVTVAGDTETIQAAITGFIEQYNKVQSLIDAQSKVETGSDGKVTAAVLARESELGEIASRLRSLVFSPLSGAQSGVDHLQDLGYDTGSEDNALTLKDAQALTDALVNRPGGVAELFTSATSGLAVQLDDYLERLVGDDGSLVAKQDNLTRQASDIDTQVAELERVVQANRERMMQSFIAMETAQAQINQQLQFLSQRFGTSAPSSG